VKLRSPAPWAVGLAALLAVVTFAPAQPPRPVAPRDAVGPDDVRRVGDWLRGMQGGQGFDPELMQKALEFLGQNPQFAKQVEQLKNNPELAKQIEQFKKTNPTPSAQQLEQFAKQLKQNPALQGGPGFDPKNLEKQIGGLTPKPGEMPAPSIGGLSGTGNLPQGGNPSSGSAKAQVGTPPPNTPSVLQPTDPGAAAPPQGFTPIQPQKGPSDLPGSQPWTGGPAGSSPLKGPNITSEQQKEYQKMAGWWEKNVGPLNDSPAVKQLIVDFATGSGSSNGQSSFNDLFGDGQGGQSSLGKLADVNAGTSSWKFPEFGKLDFGFGSPPSMPDAGGSSIGSGPSLGGLGSGEGSWLPVILLAIVAAGGLLLWWLWPKLVGERADGPRPILGLGPWPVDPRLIADRAALVKAFEYLSVLRCGTGAKVWNHVTIAAELRRAVPEVGDLAEPLARLYALARYTPNDESLAPADLEEARGHLCRIAGVSS
jgi:hypothetical protein